MKTSSFNWCIAFGALVAFGIDFHSYGAAAYCALMVFVIAADGVVRFIYADDAEPKSEAASESEAAT